MVRILLFLQYDGGAMLLGFHVYTGFDRFKLLALVLASPLSNTAEQALSAVQGKVMTRIEGGPRGCP